MRYDVTLLFLFVSVAGAVLVGQASTAGKADGGESAWAQCARAFGRQPTSYWLPLNESVASVPDANGSPGSLLTSLARDILDAALADPVLAGSVSSVPVGVEVWTRRTRGPISFHFDKDEGQFSLDQRTRMSGSTRQSVERGSSSVAAAAPPPTLSSSLGLSHPLLSTVLYTASHGGPTIVLDREREAEPTRARRAASGTRSYLKPDSFDVDVSLVGGVTCWPAPDRILLFDGRELHGVQRGGRTAGRAGNGERITLLMNFFATRPRSPLSLPLPDWPECRADSATSSSRGAGRFTWSRPPLVPMPPAELSLMTIRLPSLGNAQSPVMAYVSSEGTRVGECYRYERVVETKRTEL